MPADWKQDVPLFRALRVLLLEAAMARQDYRDAGGNPNSGEMALMRDRISAAISTVAPHYSDYWLAPDVYHRTGSRVNLPLFAAALVRLLAAVEATLPDLHRAVPVVSTREWDTPLGRIRIAGAGNDHHSGDFLLLIDLGGDDVYEDVGRSIEPGMISTVPTMDPKARV